MRRIDVIGVAPYAVILLITSCLYYEALQIAPAAEGKLGADIWPKTVLIFAILTCVWKIASMIRFGPLSRNQPALVEPNPADSSPMQTEAPRDAADAGGFVPWIGIVVTAAYVFAFPWLGYFLATFIYVTTFVYLGNYRRPLIAACIGLAASVGFMLLFMRIVYVSLPIGVEPFAHLSTFLIRAMGIK